MTIVAMAAAVTVATAQEKGSVRVTSAIANIRAAASETSQVLTQVKQDAVLELIAVEGDWFHVRVPVGIVRVEAYISKKVSKIDTPPTAAPGAKAPESAKPAAPPPPPPTSRDSMSVVLTVGSSSNPLPLSTTRVIHVGDRIDTLSKSAATIPAGDAIPAGTSPSSTITFAWILDGAASAQIVSDRRPSFLVMFKEVPGLSPDDLAPALVRVWSAASGVRLAAAVRGRADSATRPDADWDVTRDLKQDVIKTQSQVVDRGGVKLTPLADLAPGDYAIVIRPSARRKLSGSSVLGNTGEGRVFSVIWDFTVK
jgi:hypothetical protein